MVLSTEDNAPENESERATALPITDGVAKGKSIGVCCVIIDSDADIAAWRGTKPRQMPLCEEDCDGGTTWLLRHCNGVFKDS